MIQTTRRAGEEHWKLKERRNLQRGSLKAPGGSWEPGPYRGTRGATGRHRFESSRTRAVPEEWVWRGPYGDLPEVRAQGRLLELLRQVTKEASKGSGEEGMGF